MMNNGRRATLLTVLHIPGLAINLIYVSTMGDGVVRTMLKKDTCKMVQGTMVLMQEIRIQDLGED